MSGRPPNLELIHQFRLKVFYLWRNLGDTIISFDDHVLREGCANPICFIDNINDYAAQPRDVRHHYLIRHALPWYISFHLSWQRATGLKSFVRGTYEQMVADRFTLFSRIMRSLDLRYDEATLESILCQPSEGTRFNVGGVGRSREDLSESNKALLERMLVEHPQDLSSLLHELPWWPSCRGFTTEAQRYEGAMIRSGGGTPNDEMVFLVRDGKRRWITSAVWMEQNGRTWDELQTVSREEIDSIPLGPSLSAL